MKRVKFYKRKNVTIVLRHGIPTEEQPRFLEFFRIGPDVGRCIFKSPWMIVMWVYKWRGC